MCGAALDVRGRYGIPPVGMRNHLVLTFVELVTKAVIEFRLGDDEIHQGLRLRFDDCPGEVNEPSGDLVILVAAFEGLVVVPAGATDGLRKRNQCGWAQPSDMPFSTMTRATRPLPSSKGWMHSK